jgi:hypothetical protein
MNDKIISNKVPDHTKEIIIATTLVVMTCIISCAVVLFFLILKIPN